MNRLKSLFSINPIIVKEIRSRMRGPRAFITLTVILILMGGIMYAMLQIILANSRYTTVLSPQIGQNLFAALAYLELFMICAVTPSVTAGAISSEKERQTYEMLMATPMSPSRILWGKLISALSYVFLLLFAAVPLASVVFIFGGVAPRDMLKVLIVLLITAVSYGILGLFMSALFGRTGRATIASFVVVLAFMFGPLFLAVFIAAIGQGSQPPRWILAPSPISALAAAIAPSTGQGGGAEFFYVLSGIFNTGISPISQTSIPRPLYHFSIPFYILLCIILYMLSTRLIQPTRRWKIHRKELLIGIGAVVVMIGLFAGGFLLTASRYENAVTQNLDSKAQIAPALQGPIAIQAQERVVVVPDPLGEPPYPIENTPTPPSEAPTPTPAKEVTTQAGVLTQEEEAQIYTEVLRQLYTVDHTFGNNPPNWQVIYLITKTDDKVGAPNSSQAGDPVAIPEGVLSGISKQLDDLPAQIILVETRADVSTDAKNGTVDNGKGVIFTLGNIHLEQDETIHVSASLYFSSVGAAGKTYILSKKDGVWQITGDTGVEWIS
ncbi:MAG: ABC transporter permease [Anaerolineaceae bacterium]|nr:ABC transporter permease [Anaerolineaceae bacterium]